jgi:hypothetical protein
MREMVPNRTENEDVVQAVLDAQAVTPSSQFVLRAPTSLSSWKHRGIASAVKDGNGNNIGDRCIRASFGHDLTNGHFVARFERIHGRDPMLTPSSNKTNVNSTASAASWLNDSSDDDDDNTVSSDEKKTMSVQKSMKGQGKGGGGPKKLPTELQLKKAAKKAKKLRQRATREAATTNATPTPTPTVLPAHASNDGKGKGQKRARTTITPILSSSSNVSVPPTVATAAGGSKKRARITQK